METLFVLKGDSGGPLSCQDQQSRWSLIGINSYVSGYAGATDPGRQCILSVATRVSAMVNWIDTNIAANPW